MGPSQVVVLLDTNTLLLIAKGLIAPSMIFEAINSSYRLATTGRIVEELKTLCTSGRGRLIKRRACYALELLNKLGVKVIDIESPIDADDSLVEASLVLKSSGHRVYVATSDKSLRRRLRSIGVPTIYLRRSSGRLEADWVDNL
ncbi:MAG: hypothetical protein F7B20_01215 [Aeropyrum sp.]|nr:hypothetical protein [Aeropyrum sp.]MCE4616930.1 hypothetical protein [Aeropyrum sp.]